MQIKFLALTFILLLIIFSSFTMAVSNKPKEISLKSCGTLDSPNTIYNLQNDVQSDGTCFIINAPYVTLNGNGFTAGYAAAGAPWSVQAGIGVEIINTQNTIVKNLRVISLNSTGAHNFGIHMENVTSSQILNNFVHVNGNHFYGIHVVSAHYNSMIGNSVLATGEGPGTTAFRMDFSSHNNVSNNNISINSFGSRGITSAFETSYNVFDNNYIYMDASQGAAYRLGDGASNLVRNSIVNSTEGAIIFLSGNNNFGPFIDNLTVVARDVSYPDLTVAANETRGIVFKDTYLESYDINQGGFYPTFINSKGEVKFLEGLQGVGANLSSNVQVKNNYVYVSPEFSKPANITLYNLPRFLKPVIHKNGALCSDCYNFSPISTTAVFNMTGAGTYKIVETGYVIAPAQRPPRAFVNGFVAWINKTFGGFGN